MSQLLKLDPHFKPAFDGFKLAQSLITKVANELPVLDGFLFGSAAENKNTLNSDLDILLVIPDSQQPKDYYAIVNQPFFSPVAVDWIIKTQSEFSIEKDIGGVCFIASHHGKNIFYGRK